MTNKLKSPLETATVNLNGHLVQIVYGRNKPFWDSVNSGQWEEETFIIHDRFADAEHSCIDMGAFIGSVTLYGSRIAKKVYAIEPDPVAFGEISRNVEANLPQSANVRLFNICMTPKTGKVSFGSQGDGGDSVSSLLFSEGKTKWTVDGVSFADFVAQNGIDDCNFIKMDIEGGEYDLLPSMAPLLRTFRPTLYISIHALYLGKDGGKLRGVFYRLRKTTAMMWSLRFYKNFYDPYFHFPPAYHSSSLRTKLRRAISRLSQGSFIPAFFAQLVLGAWGGTSSLVVTDQTWSVSPSR